MKKLIKRWKQACKYAERKELQRQLMRVSIVRTMKGCR